MTAEFVVGSPTVLFGPADGHQSGVRVDGFRKLGTDFRDAFAVAAGFPAANYVPIDAGIRRLGLPRVG